MPRLVSGRGDFGTRLTFHHGGFEEDEAVIPKAAFSENSNLEFTDSTRPSWKRSPASIERRYFALITL